MGGGEGEGEYDGGDDSHSSIAAKLRVHKKSGIPVGAKLVLSKEDGRVLLVKATTTILEEGEGEEGEEEEEEDEEEDGDEEEEEEEEGEKGTTTLQAGVARVKGESAEERRARKGAVKAERREKRAAKKALKQAYTLEGELQKKMTFAQDPLLAHVVHKLL